MIQQDPPTPPEAGITPEQQTLRILPVITQPPTGSRITIVQDGADEVILIPPRARSPMNYFVVAFLTIWLIAWGKEWVHVANNMLTNNVGDSGVFMVFWLGGWTLGGAMSMYFLWQLLRKPVPESFRLRSDGVAHDSGLANISLSNDQKAYARTWNDTNKKRILRHFSHQDLLTLKMRETEGTNRLTIDVGAERIDLAEAASEVEREWLFEYLAKRYH
jgi:hypothetical protein